MASEREHEEVAGGMLGRVAAKVKQAAGRVLDDEDLEREGQLQDAAVDAERQAEEEVAEAQHERVRAELEEERAETEAAKADVEAERERIEREKQIQADRERAEQAAERRAAEADRIDPDTGPEDQRSA